MSYMFAPNFEAIGQVTLILELENRPESLAKNRLIQKRLKSTAKNISCGCMS